MHAHRFARLVRFCLLPLGNKVIQGVEVSSVTGAL